MGVEVVPARDDGARASTSSAMEIWRPERLQPVLTTAWAQTCQQLAAAIAVGKGRLIVLTGPQGSGKTATLRAIASGAADGTAVVRGGEQDLAPGVTIDLVDGFEDGALPKLLATPPGVVRVLAVRGTTLPAVLAATPDATVVRTVPLSPQDVHTFVEARRSQLGLAPGAFSARAKVKMAEFCAGNPYILDRILEEVCRPLELSDAIRVSVFQVEAARQYLREIARFERTAQRAGLSQTQAQAAARREVRRAPAAAEVWAATGDGTPVKAMSAEQSSSRWRREASPGFKFKGSSWSMLQGAPVVIEHPGRSEAARNRLYWRVAACAGLVGIASGLYIATRQATRGPADGEAASHLQAAIAAPPRPGPQDDVRMQAVLDAVSAPTQPPAAAARLTPPAEEPRPQPDSPALSQPLAAPAPALAAAISKPEPAHSARGGRPVRLKDPERAARLLSIGKAYLVAGQEPEGRESLAAAAELGSAEASRLLARITAASAHSPARTSARGGQLGMPSQR